MEGTGFEPTDEEVGMEESKCMINTEKILNKALALNGIDEEVMSREQYGFVLGLNSWQSDFIIRLIGEQS